MGAFDVHLVPPPTSQFNVDSSTAVANGPTLYRYIHRCLGNIIRDNRQRDGGLITNWPQCNGRIYGYRYVVWKDEPHHVPIHVEDGPVQS